MLRSLRDHWPLKLNFILSFWMCLCTTRCIVTHVKSNKITRVAFIGLAWGSNAFLTVFPLISYTSLVLIRPCQLLWRAMSFTILILFLRERWQNIIQWRDICFISFLIKITQILFLDNNDDWWRLRREFIKVIVCFSILFVHS